jgi:hypothetical protein
MLYDFYMAKEERKYKGKHGGVVPGVILVLLGLIFLLNNYGVTNVDIGRLWPLFLIVPGVFMLYRASERK